MGDPKKTPSTWGTVKELASGAITGNYASSDDVAAQEAAAEQNSPEKVRARAALGLPGIIEPDAPKAAPAGPEGGFADTTMPAIAGSDAANQAGRQKLGETMYIDEPFAAPKVGTHIRPEGFTTAPTGGDDIFHTTFESAPQASMQGKIDLAALQGQRADALSKFYTQQSKEDISAAAASKQHAAEDQESLRQRQQRLDEATQYYTNDLQDQGKFWQNPGNIVSAIAFSLMPIFSNDPAIGVKLINQAIDRDMANRQHAASQTLGALRSNLEGYHKIAGDRQAGDLLAQAEAHRIAAQQIQQISMSFESPIAKKQAEIGVADQLTRYKAAQMEFIKANNYRDAQVMTPEMDAAHVQGANGFRKGSTAPLGGNPRPGEVNGPVPGAVQGQLGTTGIPTTSPSGKVSRQTQAIANVGGEAAISRAQGKGVVPDKEAIDAVKAQIYRRAIAAHKDPNVYFDEQKVQAQKQVEAMAVPLAGDAKSVSIIGRLQGRMKMIEALEMADHRDPNNFVGYLRKSGFPGSDSLIRQYDQLVGGDPRAAGTSKAAALDKWKADAVRSLEQEMAMAINSNIHDLSGGAVNESEQKRLDKEINPNTPWRQQMNFLDAKSHQLQASIDAHAMTAVSPLAQVYYRAAVRNGGKAPMDSAGVPGGAKVVQPAADPVTDKPQAPVGRYVSLPPDANNTPELMRRRSALGLPPTMEGDK